MTTELQQTSTEFLEDTSGLVLKHSQNITQAFLDDLKDARNASSSQGIGNYQRVASIPTAVAEAWLRDGFDIWNVSGPDIIARLKKEDLGMFMATEKRI